MLETVGASFLDGYGRAVEAVSPEAAEESLERIPAQFRGFAYEGAGMGLTMLDALPSGGGGRFARFLEGRGDEHVYVAYVGAGWALARLPRLLWSRVHAPDPLLRWLALDGYGFHQAYFKTRRYVREQYRETAFPWPAGGPADYAAHAIDQGIGRALWFVGCTHPGWVADLIDGFAEHRRADLYAGAGLAATYAAGADAEELRYFLERAGRHRPQVAQGSAFGAEARVRAGIALPQTGIATGVLCGLTPEQAARLCLETRPEPRDVGGLPAYEIWRRRIAARFTVSGGVRS